MPVETPCPDPDELQQVLLGFGDGPRAEALLRHLDTCARCAARAEQAADDALADAPRAGPGDESNPLWFSLPEGLADAVPVTRVAIPDREPGISSCDTRRAGATPLPGFAQDVAEYLQHFLTPPEAPDEIGRLGGYRILKVLGMGGMGVVLHAEDATLGRAAALKVMLPVLAASSSARRRFLREGRAAAAIDHVNVVPIFQVGEAHGVPFLTMPLLRGETLETRLKRDGMLRAGEVLRIGREAAEGLAAAHAHGLVHRDVKPANVWLEEGTDRVKILDFGLARVASDDQGLTQEGAILGTPAYMSPEQANGKPVDHRGDLFSLGCVLYRMATGAQAFDGPDLTSTLLAVAQGCPRPPDRLNPYLPPALAALILQLLAKDPADRPASARHVVAALAAIEANPRRRPEELGLPPRPGRPRGLVFVAILLLLTLVGVALVIATSKGTIEVVSEDPDVKIVVEKEGKVVAVLDPRSGPSHRFDTGNYSLRLDGDPEGVELDAPHEFTLRRGDRRTVTIRRMTSARVMEGHGRPVVSVALSPDGRRAISGGGYHIRNGEPVFEQGDFGLRVWDLRTGKEIGQLEERLSPALFVAVSPHGRTVLTGHGGFVRLRDLETGKNLRRVAAPGGRWSGAFSPDGRLIADAGDQPTVRLWEAETGEEVGELVGHTRAIRRVAFSADGRRLLSGSFDGTARLWDVETRKELRQFDGHRNGVSTVAFSPDRRHILTGGDDNLLKLWDAETGDLVRTFTGHTGPVQTAAFTPDGRFVLSAAHDTTAELWMWDVGGGRVLKRFAGHKGLIQEVVATSDGRYALTASLDEGLRLWRLPEPLAK